MIINSSLMTHVAKARPGNVRASKDPGALDVPPTCLNAGRMPFPVTNVVQNLGVLAAGTEVAGSILAERSDQLNAVPVGSNWLVMPSGLWDFEIMHWVQIQGAISDPTATVQLSFLWVDGVQPSKSSIISQVHGGQTVFQQIRRQFTMLITKDVQITLLITGAAGLGTSLNISRLSVIANRIL
jgi:hypothetical protein